MSITKRSLKASSTGIQQAKKAFARKGWTQENLASEVNLKTRQPIWRFFTGRPIERHTFVEICSLLDLNWVEIAQDPPVEILEKISDSVEKTGNIDINVLIQQVRSKRYDKIQHRCSYLTLLDLHNPVNINDIYIDVDILEQIGSQPGINIAQLQNWTPEEFERFSPNNIYPKKMSGIEAAETYSKLRILGSVGAGKTVFLQHLALLCNQGQFAPNRVPVFINLRDFADESRTAGNFSLFNSIYAEFITSEINNPTALTSLLHNGRILLLLDGLDQVSSQDFPSVVQEIRRFSEKYYNNLFIVSCRTAAKEFKIKGFTDVEIAPLTEEKITQFAEKWLAIFNPTDDVEEGLQQAVEFTKSLNLPEKFQFRQLVVRPLFLYIACLMFSRSEDFFFKFSDFSKLCLDSLLGKWDQSKSIKRDEVYSGFSLAQKLKLFRQLAMDSFEEGKYFFHKKQIQQYINGYLLDLANDGIDPEQLQVDSEAVLKAIELQHGILVERVPDIFSFSFSGFQDYFTAQQIADHYNLQKSEQSLKNLVSNLGEPRWHKIFLLTGSLLESGDVLIKLIQEKIEEMVAQNPEMQEYLTGVSQHYQRGKQSRRESREWLFIQQNLNLNHEQQQILEYYYKANQLLLDCLQSDCAVTEAVRQEIEASLFLATNKFEQKELA
ncbi:MAG: NACHT domain-containing NTPase [Lyngbya sp.]|nr:NACHT domain-containing NTPase [Lyngbya sp.]